jgi:hypothetical protein
MAGAPASMSAAATRPHRRRAAAVALALLATVLLVAACGDPGRSAAGIVVALDASGGQVSGFTLRTQDGATMTFVIGELETDGAAFPASHLAEHAVTLQPIAVGYRVRDGRNVVHRMVDAPWAAPT